MSCRDYVTVFISISSLPRNSKRTMSVFLLFIFTLITWYVIKHYYLSYRFPPGLPRVPFLGTIPFLNGEIGSRVILSSLKLIPKYGDVIGYFIGPSLKIVFVQDFAKAKELSVSEDFLGRFGDSTYAVMRGHEGHATGVALTQGPIWKHLRRFSLSTLKEFGFGKRSIGTIIEEEALSVVEEDFVMNHASSDCDTLVEHPFNISVFNIIWRIVAGKRFERSDTKLRKQVALLSEVFKTAFMEFGLPIVYQLFPKSTGLDVKARHVSLLKQMMTEEIELHREQLVRGEPKDFIDVYLEAMEEDPVLTIPQLTGICMDFFEAGGETVGSTLSWLLLYMALNPEAQTKCRNEIDQIVGSRNVTLDDKPSLPYVEATIMEVQRLSCVAPAGLEHRAVKDTYLFGHFIPKGTLVYYNIYRFHMDPQYWEDPHLFRPERFLDPVTGKLIRKDQFVPFGFGKRVCMGETLAKSELFLFTSILLKHVVIGKPKHHPCPDPKNDIAGFTRSPKPFYVKISKRQSF